MSKTVRIKATLNLTGTEISILKKALQCYRHTVTDKESNTVNDLIELTDNLTNKIKINQKKERIYGEISKVR